MALHIHGVRHLSPVSSYHLLNLLDKVKPSCVLIEGLSDATPLIDQITQKGVTLPIAILAYTEEPPIRSILYPLAEYSPEYQAILWAYKNQSTCAFIDLPSKLSIKMRSSYKEDQDIEGGKDKNQPDQDISHAFTRLKNEFNEPDFESFWERYFEHQFDNQKFNSLIKSYANELRESTEYGVKKDIKGKKETERLFSTAFNITRERYMNSRISGYIKEGHKDIVVITGAYHADKFSSINSEEEYDIDKELKELPHTKTKLTLMPYSYLKLSTQSGYGAGNHAPYYYDIVWQLMQENKLEELPHRYISQTVKILRKNGMYRSTAEVIEGVKLAQTLSKLKNDTLPNLNEIENAVITTLGHGDYSVVAQAIAKINVGTKIGSLPQGISKTPLQEDFYVQLKELRLERFKTNVAENLSLDLRENIRVKSERSAFLSLERSFFLHRLKFLEITFCTKSMVTDSQGTWSEKWALRWTPEVEIELIENSLGGDTILQATSFELKQKVEATDNINDLTKLIDTSISCGIPEAFTYCLDKLKNSSIDTLDIISIGNALNDLSFDVSYGNVRKIKTDGILPVIEQLFYKATLTLLDSASCSDEAAQKIVKSMKTIQHVSNEHYKHVQSTEWERVIRELAKRDDKNPKLSGYAFSILLGRNKLTDEEISEAVSRRLSPGIPADIGAGWFEGVADTNNYILLSKKIFWESLSKYIESLDAEQFLRAVVFLRRALYELAPRDKQKIAEILKDVWKVKSDKLEETLLDNLDQDDSALDELKDMEFDF